MVRDLYGTGMGADAPISYTVPLNHFTGTTVFTATPSIGPKKSSIGPRSTFPLHMTHSTIVPHILTIPTGNAVVNQAAIGTPVTPRPTSSLPFGYRALNTPTATTTQVVPGSSIPIQQPIGTGLGGPNPFSDTGQSFTSGSQILGTLPQAGGHHPTGGQFPFGGHPHAGGKPQSGATINHTDKMCLPHPIRGMSLFRETHSSRQDTILKLHNNLLMDKCQIQPITLKTHPVILRSHMLLKTPQILCTLVNTNLIQEGPLVTIIHITQ
jgi:hypothetical protein